MSTPAGGATGGQAGGAVPPEGDRRKGGRRATDRGDGPDRRTGISVSRSFHRQSFFDHPWWVAGTVLVGIVLGVGVMSVNDWYGHKKKAGAIEMKIVPPDTRPPQ